MNTFLKFALGICLVGSTVASAAEGTALRWVCKQNKARTKALVEKKLQQHPEARGRSGDDGGIDASSLKSFDLVISPEGTVTGSVAGYGKWKVPGQDSDDLGVTISKVKTARKGGYNGFYINADDYDHFSYSVRLYPDTKTASVHETFDFDCGGNGGFGYAELDCTVTSL